MGAGELNNVDLEKTNKERTKSGSTVGLQWLYSGSTTNKRRTKDEEKTNKK